MKKILFLIPLVVALITISRTPAHAYNIGGREFGTVIIAQAKDDSNNVSNMWYKGNWYICCWDSDNISIINDYFSDRPLLSYPDMGNYIFWGFPDFGSASIFLSSGEYFVPDLGITFTGHSLSWGNYPPYCNFDTAVFVAGYSNQTGDNVYSSINDFIGSGGGGEEEEEETKTWFKNLWDFIMDTLAITDDFSNDLYDWIFEGEDGEGGHSGGHSFEYVTPTPSPTPTPAPTPTPYTLDIVDNNGNPVYTITGIPNQTITINNTTNNENGDDFDIFEVDVKLLPSGGVSNPKDGLNSVMESNLEVLEDIDITPVGASFSVLPSDWFIMLGAIICMPFLGGFISKLLK